MLHRFDIPQSVAWFKAGVRRRPRLRPLLVLLIILAIISIVAATGLGAVNIPANVTSDIVLNHITQGFYPSNGTLLQQNIVWNLRLPRVLLGFVVGAALAIAGVAMQALVRNQLADPFLLGVSPGAEMFGTLGMLFGVFSFLGTYALSLSAFLGAAFSLLLVYALSRVKNKIVITQLLLSGVVVAMIFQGITKVIVLSAPNALGLHNAEFWMSGSLANTKWSFLGLPTIVMLTCGIFLTLNYRVLNLLIMGEETAATLGISVRSFQKILLFVTSLLAGTTIAVSGTIGFIGLICPHFARLLVGGDHRKVLPVASLIGGILVVWTDVLARTILAPEELPLGILTSILGGPFFILLLKKNRKH
ncbi:FecCD family ABC transporter permease [Candidatus Enterococcus ferrettii]|uniref:Iron complex transport system permease n=1 Tax=Candidatus Enterococcus ferrettii TaxID=2815324 RepID=A0ABV0ETN3_9ENTE|nr:iron ABC transporter permease [Enterococcus sp. 665A]MBO1342249.1 iron ABC transporter permease [Enterococcus sp. 665A]